MQDLVPPPFLGPEHEEAARAATAEGAVALVISPSGIVLHLRDDKPGIPNPGRWSLFGGAIEDGGSPAEALRRELEEELGLVEFDARPLWRLVDTCGDGRLLTLFEVHTPLTPEQPTLTEGEELAAFTPDEALRPNLAHFCRQVLERYDAAASPR